MKRRSVAAMLVMTAVMVSSCQTLTTVNTAYNTVPETDAQVQESTAVETAETVAVSETQPAATVQTAAPTQITMSETSEAPEALEGEVLTNEQMLEFFAQYADEYLMSSGAGGWASYLNVSSSGSFTYNYHDFDAGAYYICHAQGQFSNMIKVDDNTYTVEVIYMNYEHNEGEEWSETDTDGTEINYVAADSYGIHQGDTLTFYVQGSAVADLPEGYVVWYAMPRALPLENVPDPFPLSGFYNPADDCSFIEDDYE